VTSTVDDASSPAYDESGPATSSTVVVEALSADAPTHPGRVQPRHLFGVRCTSRGVLFVQPARPDEDVAVAGDFNAWAPDATPLRFNSELGVAEALVSMSPGSHQYRIIRNGSWETDPYNAQREPNPHGDHNSVVHVPEIRSAS
jgi:1,4-alpha-glucan branching enzyme